jgi:hypothetical protein
VASPAIFLGAGLALLVATSGAPSPEETLDLLAAQRLIVSETGTDVDPAIKAAILWCSRNLAHDRGQTLYRSLTGGAGFGDAGGPRPAATNQTPALRDILINAPLIHAVLGADQGADPTGGANDWFQPVEQDYYASIGMPGYVGCPASCARARARANGEIPMGTVGTGSDRVEMFRRPM